MRAIRIHLRLCNLILQSDHLTLLKIIKAMMVTCVHIHVKPDAVDGFIIATIANHRESAREPGNLRFDFIQQTDDPCRFMLYEAYESEEAAATHKMTVHYRLWRDAVKDFMAEPRQGIKYNILEPYDKTKW